MREMIPWFDATKKQKIDRWEHVLKVLKGLTPHEKKSHFTMATWAEETDCGTVACAAGFCGFDEWFNKRGFQLIFSIKHNQYTTPAKSLDIPTYVIDFFGAVGTRSIFFNTTPRPITEVIREVTSYTKALKESLHD
jgi:hypothetical protein